MQQDDNSPLNKDRTSETSRCGQTGLMPVERVLLIVIRIFLGAVFIYASVDKILHPATFALAIYNYQILPNELIPLTAIVLPWLELFLGIGLILGVWLPGCVFMVNLLMLIFISALVFNIIRGLDISCGCFSISNKEVEVGTMVGYVIRDMVLFLLGIYLFLRRYIFRPHD